MEKQFNFVYITTNLINGKQYIGEHSTHDLNLWHTKDYLGSGLYLKRAIKEYGKQNFKREILEYFDTNELSFIAQEKYINKYNTLVKNGGYNISPKGGHFFKGSMSCETKKKIGEANKISLKGKKHSIETVNKRIESNVGKHNMAHSKETKLKMSILQKEIQNRPDVIEKKRIARTGILHTEEAKIKISKNNARNTYWKGKTRNIEVKSKMSEAHKGIKPWNIGIELSDETKLKIGLGNKGKKLTNDTKLKMSIAAKGKPKSDDHKKKLAIANLGKIHLKIYCKYCNKEYANYMYKLYHGDKCKNKIKI